MARINFFSIFLVMALKVISINVRGLQTQCKRDVVFSSVRKFDVIFFLARNPL